MINKGTEDGIYELTSDTILSDMKKFNDFMNLRMHPNPNPEEIFTKMIEISKQCLPISIKKTKLHSSSLNFSANSLSNSTKIEMDIKLNERL